MEINLATFISILSIIVAIFGVIIAYLGYQLKKNTTENNDIVKTATESAELKSDLGYIRRGVDDIKLDIKASEREMQRMNGRLIKVEESTKQAHKRIDEISRKGD